MIPSGSISKEMTVVIDNDSGGYCGTNDSGSDNERIFPLIQRPIYQRLDVMPFVVCYTLLITFDVHLRRTQLADDATTDLETNNSSRGTSTIAAWIDVTFIVLLVTQLIAFLKCQWDPTWHARVAYHQYTFTPSVLSAAVSSSRKIRGMVTWTHCLVVPPSPFIDDGDCMSASSKGKRGRITTTAVCAERPGIVPVEIASLVQPGEKGKMTTVVASICFRGWIYRCCCTVSNDHSQHHVDFPMENVWKHVNVDWGGRDDRGGECVLDEGVTSNSVPSMYTWEPRFHRLHFPVDLSLDFYTRQWKGHHCSEIGSSQLLSVSNIQDSTLWTAHSIYGDNATDIPLPPYLMLLQQQLLQPMFLFQAFCVMLWCLDEYWIYAIYTLCSLLMFECVQAYARYKSVRRLREDATGGGDDEEDAEHDDGTDMVVCYRMGTWTTVPARRLVVGDIVSLVSMSVHDNSDVRYRSSSLVHHRRPRQNDDKQRGCTVPADLLLMSGRAVVNEAMLTGESVPQVKESIGTVGGGEATMRLDLGDGSSHSRCVIFAGTVLMDHHSSEEEAGEGLDSLTSSSSSYPVDTIPPAPNRGLMCFVLRTGFDTIQGQLLRTLAYHAEAGGGGGNGGGGDGVNARETFYFLLLLLVCALASAATVIDSAWGDITRNHFKLILHVVIIITSVIPPELPMELSLAVTQSLSELVKRYNIFCTEPFRIPLAGLVDTCCFDKTGTLTSDSLRLHGVRLPTVVSDDISEIKLKPSKTIIKEEEDLILFDGILSKLASTSPDDVDKEGFISTIRSLLPRETLRVMVGCQSLATTHVTIPGLGVQLDLCGDPLEKAVMEGCGFTIHPRSGAVVEKGYLNQLMNGTASQSGAINIIHRFGFSSKLRRMTVLAVDGTEPDTTNATLWALTKGAPEALKPMLDPRSLPIDYDQSYLRHMSLGRRVLALAYRDLGKNTSIALARWKSSRDSVETKLKFAGLLIMDSPLKADSARVINDIRSGNLNVVMVTGDAMLTAAEVARRVGIIDASQECTYELCHLMKDGKQDQFVFLPLDHSVREDFNKDKQLEYTPTNYAYLEELIRNGNANFCVSGDVLIKLASHAIGGQTHDIDDDRAVLNHPAARLALARLVPLCTVFARHAPRYKEAVISAFNASGRHTLMCGDGTNDVGALKQAHVGVSIISVPDLEAKQRSADGVISAIKAEEKKERKSAKKKSSKSGMNGHSSANKPPKRRRAQRIECSLKDIADAEGELNFITLGNASLASPFTSRKTSIRCCKDILAQGRCTLVAMIQIYKILGVQCLVNALVLTKLHQKGVKQGDRQLTAVGVVVAVLFLFVTRGKPMPKLSTKKPPSSVLCRGMLCSMAVQFGIHFVAIMAVTFISDAYVDPYDPSIVPDGPFHPNTLNTATFLITVLSTVNTFLVNYQGKPHMEQLSENVLLFRSIQACSFVLYVCASEIFPPLNQLLQLSPLPTMGPPTFNHHDGSKSSMNAAHYLLLEAVNSIGFRAMLCVVMSLNTALVMLAENSLRAVLDK